RPYVTVGDANLADVTTDLKLGVTAIVLSMIEDDYFGDLDLTLAAPVQAMRRVSYDLSLSAPLELANGTRMTALEMQWEELDLARKYAADRGRASVDAEVGRDVLQRWSGSIAAANWDSLVFDLGTDPLRRVPMMEPLRGTAAHVDSLLEGCSTPVQLLEALEA